MLILTRKVGECVVIDNGNIKVHVLELRGGQVRIGIEAPKEVTINRLEIHEKITATTVFKRSV